MKKFLLTVLGIAAVGAAHAQLSYAGVSHGASEELNGHITHAVQGSNVNIGSGAGGSLDVALMGHTNVQLQRLTGSTWMAKTHTFFSFEVGNFPVEMSTIVGGNTLDMNGKQVLAGGALHNTGTTMRTFYATSWNEFIDADADGVYDPGVEDLFEITGSTGSASTNTLTSNGYDIYDRQVAWPSLTPYVLGSGRTYVLQLTAHMFGDLNDGATDPFHVATHEFNNTFNGWSLHYTYQAVPEPATFASLGLAAMALVSRRRRSKN